MKKLFRVEVWIDGKPVHTFQGPLSHVRNPRLAQTLMFRDILRQLYARGRPLPSYEELRTLRTLRTLVNRLERYFLRQVAEKRGEEL